MQRDELVTYLDDLLRVREIEDRSRNGLQVEGNPEVETVAFTVDASLAAFRGAREAGAQMLVVHHGLFWDEVQVVRGPFYRRLKTLLDADLNLYAAHVPLDMHPELGNNVALANLIGLEDRQPFGEFHGKHIGLGGRLPTSIPRERLVCLLTERLGAPRVLPFGPQVVQRVAICSGKAPQMVVQASEERYDTYLSGEADHTFFHEAKERGINVVYGGHYLTETLGPKALMAHLAERFGLRTVWLDLPTGL
ncbi:MAG: Nif3-like dinuclear metal center hexameric protein [Anaerolineae bacterium]